MHWLGLLAVAVLLAGCGGGSSESSAAGGAGAGTSEAAAVKPGCELLTDAEVGQALGTTVASHEESGLNGCRWRTDRGTQLMLDVYAGSALVSSTCDAQKYLGTGREEAVEGLGDSALWKTSGSLVVCAPRGVIRFNLDNSTRTVPEDKDAIVALARTVLGRL